MECKILGTGCARCQALFERVKCVVAENGLAVTVTKETDVTEILAAGLSTPALTLDGKVVCSGRLPETSEILGWLKDAGAREG